MTTPSLPLLVSGSTLPLPDAPIQGLPGRSDYVAAGLKVLDVFLIAETVALADGGVTLCPLSRYFLTFSSAEIAYREALEEHPSCGILVVHLVADPTNPEQISTLAEVERQRAVELTRAGAQ